MTAIKSKRPLSLGQAKTKFIATVQTGIEELMLHCGYSRARATHALLKEIGKDCDPPSDTEIFHMMELQGLGNDEATQALVVSKAVRRIMKEQGYSAVDALGDLIHRLDLTNLLTKASPYKSNPSTVHQESNQQGDDLKVTSLNSVSSGAILPHRKSRHPLKPPSHAVGKNPQLKATTSVDVANLKSKHSRKRSISEEKKDGMRSRTDSVTEEVHAKLETHTTPKGKQSTSLPPPAKRPREL